MATRKFLISYLSNIELQNRGDMRGLLTRPVESMKPVLDAFVWMYWYRQYLIFTWGLMEKGRMYTCMQCRQEEPASNADTNMVDMTIPQSIILDIYYSTCGHIDRHNRCCQESPDTEKIAYEILVEAVQPIYF